MGSWPAPPLLTRHLRLRHIRPRAALVPSVQAQARGRHGAPACAPTVPRKKFAAAAVNGRLYVAGGSARIAAVEEYDPATDACYVVAEALRRRYGCTGAGSGGVFYVAGGVAVSGNCTRTLEGLGCFVGAFGARAKAPRESSAAVAHSSVPSASARSNLMQVFFVQHRCNYASPRCHSRLVTAKVAT